jgi:hypothetical protein
VAHSEIAPAGRDRIWNWEAVADPPAARHTPLTSKPSDRPAGQHQTQRQGGFGLTGV